MDVGTMDVFVRLEKRKQIKTVYFSKAVVTEQRVERVLCVLWVITWLRYSNLRHNCALLAGGGREVGSAQLCLRCITQET